ncbi:hypothetical protein AGRA3207_003933 [Actinomadura graeca]|uniref:DUF5666 domain-containing protein n=1 Tax=Actinomadura graeca TaxID=2750812 RepID=A0ABX8QVR4_9ACTN|nr:DUF5666 domain-containing protein [Actinomadura graeca]QXJ22865.1 hypothetical protein AGRA3207_003933 [Actinomadura graeca]
MQKNKKTLAAGIGAAGLLGLGLYLAVPAAADDPAPSPSASPSATGKPHPDHGMKRPWAHEGRRGRGGLGIHGEATVRRKDGFGLNTWQRGKVTGLSGAALTVRSEDGASWTWTTDANTRVRKKGDQAKVSDLKNGDEVLVFGERSGDTRTAKIVRAPDKD